MHLFAQAHFGDGAKDLAVEDFMPFRDRPQDRDPEPGSPEFEERKKALHAQIKGLFASMAQKAQAGGAPGGD